MMSSRRKSEPVLVAIHSPARRLAVVLLPLVVACLGGRCVSAHDHTAPKYPVTLLPARADSEPAVAGIQQTLDTQATATWPDSLPRLRRCLRPWAQPSRTKERCYC